MVNFAIDMKIRALEFEVQYETDDEAEAVKQRDHMKFLIFILPIFGFFVEKMYQFASKPLVTRF